MVGVGGLLKASDEQRGLRTVAFAAVSKETGLGRETGTTHDLGYIYGMK